MNRIRDLINSVSAKPSVVIHLGAGLCKDYVFYKRLGSNQIIFVEPDQQLADAANTKFDNNNDVTIISGAIAPNKGQHSFNVMNNRRFSSLLLPTGLLDFYPNIKVSEEISVEVITLEQLCQQTELHDGEDNLLIAELLGMEKEVFPSVEIDTLHKFKWIVIRSSEKDLYQSDSDWVQDILPQTMRSAGYTVLVLNEDTPPFINILCIRNEAEIDNARLQAREADLSNTIRVLEHDFSSKIAEHKVLENNFLKRKDDMKQALVEKSKQVSAVKEQLLSITDIKNQQLQSIAELKDAADAKTVELEQTQAQVIALVNDNDQKSLHVVRLTNSIDEKTKEITEVQQDMRINNKLMLKSNADLKDLQLQYRTALQHQERQHTLLCELKDKLRQASEFYQQLNLQSLVLDNDMMELASPDTSDLPDKDASTD